MSESNSTTKGKRVPLTEERLNELVHMLTFRYDDQEQAAALIELLYGFLREKNGAFREDLITRSIQRAFTFTPEFRKAVNVYLGIDEEDGNSSTEVKESNSGQESEKVN